MRKFISAGTYAAVSNLSMDLSVDTRTLLEDMVASAMRAPTFVAHPEVPKQAVPILNSVQGDRVQVELSLPAATEDRFREVARTKGKSASALLTAAVGHCLLSRRWRNRIATEAATRRVS